MRARIRSVKPEIHTDEELWDAEQETELPLFRAFIGLWNYADREGRFEWRPRRLKPYILPYWNGDFERVLDALASRGWLVKYTCGGKVYGFVRSFKNHQNLNGKEPASELPDPRKGKVVSYGSERVSDTSSSCGAHVEDTKEAGGEHVDDVPIPLPSRSLPDPDPDPDPNARADDPGRPVPRRVLMAEQIWPNEYEPLDAHRSYSASIGLDTAQFDQALIDLRDKFGLRKHDAPWLDEKFTRFLEQEAGIKPGKSDDSPKVSTPDPAVIARIEREARERTEALRREQAGSDAPASPGDQTPDPERAKRLVAGIGATGAKS